MGSAINDEVLHGIAVPDERITPDALTEKDDTTVLLRSAYTQADPHAGISQPGGTTYQMALGTSGGTEQDASLEIMTQKGGHPVPDDGGYIWRNLLDKDGTTEYKGWDSFVSVTDFDEVFYTVDAVNTPEVAVIRLQNGDVLATGIENVAGGVRIFYYTTSTGSWTTVGPFDPKVDEQPHTQYALCQLPTGRVLLFWLTADKRQIDVNFSDDNGATWQDYAQRILNDTIDDGSGVLTEPSRLRVSYSNGQMLLIYSFTHSAGYFEMAQFASIDEGHTFTEVSAGFYNVTSYPALCPSIVAIPAGGFAVGAVANVAGVGTYRARLYRIGSAYTPLDEAAATDIWTADDLLSSLYMGLTAWLDEDNILYIITTDGNFDANPGTTLNVQLYRSLDFGATIEEYNAPIMNLLGVLQYIHSYDCTSTGGKALLCTRWTDAGGTALDKTSVAAIGLGGFSSHTLPDSRYALAEQFTDINALAFAPDDAANPTDAGFYGAMVHPDLIGWTRVTAGGGTRSLSANAEEAVITAGAGDSEYYHRDHTGSPGAVMAQFAVRIVAGSGNLNDSSCYVRLRLGDNATYGYDITIRLADTGYRVYDNEAGATIATVTTNPLTTRRWFRVLLSKDSAQVNVWTAADGHVKNYALEATGAGLTDRGAAGYHNQMFFGNLTVGTNTSYWRMTGYSMVPYLWAPGDLRLGSGWTNPIALRPKSYSGRRTLIDDGIYIAASGGPTTLGETWQIDADYDYPLWAIHPYSNPSPSKPWRSVDTSAAVDLVWDTEKLYTAGIFDNNLICVFVLGGNFKDALFQGWNVSTAAWVTLAKLDAADGYGPLDFDRIGRKVVPDAGVATQGREWLFREDHVHDTFDLGATGGGDPPGTRYAHITHNSEGSWVGLGAKTKTPVVTLDEDDLDGGEVATHTDGYIWRRNFGAYVAAYQGTYDHFRLQIPVQSTADGYFEIGQLVIAPVAVLGRQYDKGYAYTHMHPVSVETLENDQTRIRKEGVEARRFTFSIVANTVDVSTVEMDDPSPDYRTAEAGESMAVATMHDTTRSVEGIIRRTHGPEVPVLLLPAIPRSTVAGQGIVTTLETRRRVVLWGRITTTDPNVEAITGTEGICEAERLQLITLDEVT